MAIEAFGDLPPQYLDLLNASAREIGMSQQDVAAALKGLTESIPEQMNQENLTQLLKAIAMGKFPFIILATGANRDHRQIIESASLIPDPQLVDITRSGELVNHLFSRYEDFDTSKVSDIELVGQVKQRILGRLITHPNIKTMKSNTVAVARTKNAVPVHPQKSLSFGYPYLNKMKQIQMGTVGKVR